MNKGDIPTISINAQTVPEAWEKAVLAVWEHGAEIKTQYDKPEDPPSRDATVIVTVEEPFAEPRIHKNFPGVPEELEAYRQEVVDGIHNHWICPEENKWTYTYHERLFKYSPCDNLKDSNSSRPFIPVDQIQYMIDYLAKSGHTRRAQAITWQPTCDPQTDDPPCLQRVWCRMLKDEEDCWVLNMNTHWRSRCLYKAWFMNVYALTDLQRVMVEKISEKMGEGVRIGRYVDVSDSLHLYGSYFKDIEPEIKKMKENPIYFNFPTIEYASWYVEKVEKSREQRTYRTDHPAFKMMTDEARENLRRNPDFYSQGDK